MRKFTKIIATVGPSISSPGVMEQLLKSGVNAFRFNFSHGTREEHLEKIRWAMGLRRKGYVFALFADLSGPKFRLGEIEGGNIFLKRGQEFVLTTKKMKGDGRIAYAPLEPVIHQLKKGDIILLADGTVELEVKRVVGDSITTIVRIGGEISSHKGINIPNRMGNVCAITEKDQKDIEFAMSAGIRIFAISFVGSEKDLLRAMEIFTQIGSSQAFIISKIERHDAVLNFGKILQMSGGIMIARGDLAVEIPYWEVPILQKELIIKSREAGRPVITATQMLRSILFNPVPTRAEISDIANAVLDGTDALMLSEETAVAQDPVRSVKVMRSIVAEAEKFQFREKPYNMITVKDGGVEWEIAQSSVRLAHSIKAKIIITPTASGATALRISSLRPNVPIVAPTFNDLVFEFLNLSYGVYPLKVNVMNNIDELLAEVKKKIFEKGFAKEGDFAVITGGYPFGKPGTTNMLKVEKL